MLKLLKNLFVPHEGNDFHPHMLQKVAMGAMVFLVLLSFLVANIQALIWTNVDWLVGAVLPAVVVEKTNKERSSDELVVLKRNSVLDAAAQLKADDMAKNGYFAHYSPTGVSPWHWFNEAGYGFLYAGENLAVHFTDSSEVVRAWMKSPTHRANIMNGIYTEIGIGVAEGKFEGSNTVFVVQFFGTPSVSGKVAIPTPVVETEPVVVPVVPPKTDAVAGESTVALKEEVLPKELVVSESEETVVAFADLIPRREVDEVVEITTPTTTVLTSDTIETTSSSSAIAQTDDTSNIQPPVQVSSGEKLLTSPLLTLQIIYMLIGAFVLVLLLISLLLEWRRHHPLQIVYSGGLLVAMSGLFYLHSIIIGGATLV